MVLFYYKSLLLLEFCTGTLYFSVLCSPKWLYKLQVGPSPEPEVNPPLSLLVGGWACIFDMFDLPHWFFPHFFCPFATFHRLHFASSDRIPVPYPSVSQCLDRLPIALVLRPKFSLLALPTQLKFSLLPFLLLLAGDIEIYPGPAPLIFAHLNTCSIASINNKHDKPALVQEFITDNSIEILSVNETFLSDNELQSTINTFTPPNFSFIHKPRSGNERGGGVGFIYRSYIKLSEHTIPIFKSFESICVKFTIASKSYIMLTVCRPPSSSVKEFKTEFSSLLETMVSLPSELIVSGDFNFHVDHRMKQIQKVFFGSLNLLVWNSM